MVGLDRGMDDALLQNKIKDSVFPRPVFSYSPVIYKEKLYGLIEIPVHKDPQRTSGVYFTTAVNDRLSETHLKPEFIDFNEAENKSFSRLSPGSVLPLE